jgi:hypothetical protein
MQHRKYAAQQHGAPEDGESGNQHGGRQVERGSMNVSLALLWQINEALRI